MDDNLFKVFVHCITFNHAKYIKNAMDGFCMQQTTFPFVCGIVDDASTDCEPNIIQEYFEEHFDLNEPEVAFREETEDFVRFFARNKTNRNCFFVVVYLKYNHFQINKSKLPYVSEWRDRATYIAHCEGDDYWIDPTKLQKQVVEMEKDPQNALCHTSIRYYYEDIHRFVNSKDIKVNSTYKTLVPTDVFRGYRIQLCTILYRRTMRQDFEMNNRGSDTPMFLMGDGQLYYEMAKRGKIVFIPNPMVVYRVHRGSASRKSVKPQLRFALSCAEMQLYYVKKDASDSKEIEYFQKKYDVALSQYLLWDPQFKPMFESSEIEAVQSMSKFKKVYKKTSYKIRCWMKKKMGLIRRRYVKEI